MLAEYKKKYHKTNFQYVLVDLSGSILESDNVLFKLTPKAKIQDIHPFFESMTELFLMNNQRFDFTCVNLDNLDNPLIVDIIIHTKKEEPVLIIIEDLTKHYNDYQLTAQRRNESLISYEVLELKNEYLLEKEQFKNNFIANFSHQLRNPITASSIFSKFLSNTDLNSEQKNYLDIILSANTDLKNRIEDILDTAKIESGKLILNASIFELNKFLKNISVGYKILASKKGLKFNVKLGHNLPDFIFADEYRLKQIIGNLLNNAITYTYKGLVSLDVSLNYIRAGKANLRFEITDTGIGIEDEQQEFIFERFNKVNAHKSNNRNIGLGLSIVKYLINEMDGNITMKSSVEQGSQFTFNISLRIAEKPIQDTNAIANKPRNKFKNKKNLVLIEDSELIQLSILKILSSDGNFFMNIISNGEDVVSSILEQDVDIILISNTIQRYSAEELALSIQSASKSTKKIPILALTTEVFKDDIKRYKASGIKDVITKPFDDNSLLKQLYKYTKK
ncbi:hybrid sensor histidine kinase/response regulator [Winogradskyella sp. PE311]|uniref:ATP-binding response regulator n=1 Tax=Winogradskyella sp. PE311 TaxID=3366943 RepID=UPI00397F9846